MRPTLSVARTAPTASAPPQPGATRWGVGMILPVLLILAWAACSAAGWTNPYLLPPPWQVWRAAVDMTVKGELSHHVIVSLDRVAIGFLLTVALAAPLAVMVHLLRTLDDGLKLVLEFLRVTPPLAAIPLLILWLGIGEGSKLAVIVLASFFPVYMNILSGLRQTDRRLIEMADTLGLTRGDKVRHILLPSALPSIVTGLRLGFGYSWRALIGAELIAASAGLGYLILDAGEMARTDRMFVGILLIAFLGIGSDVLFMSLACRFAGWGTGGGDQF